MQLPEGPFSRTELLLGSEAMEKLAAATVAVVGLGGVGSWAAEALARSGVGGLGLIDQDDVSVTNVNRQCVALASTIGRPKAEVMRERVLDVNPGARARALRERFDAASAERLVEPGLSYVVDAIDSVSAKVELVCRARSIGVPVISAMGAGNKLDPSLFEIVDLSETSVCPLARAVRKELAKRGIRSLPVVYSREPPMDADAWEGGAGIAGRRSVPGSVAFVPPVVGFFIASRVVRDIVGYRIEKNEPSHRSL